MLYLSRMLFHRPWSLEYFSRRFANQQKVFSHWLSFWASPVDSEWGPLLRMNFFFLFACKLNFICSNLDVVVDVFLSQVERLAAVSGWFATSFGADRNSLNPIDMNFAHLCLPTYSRWGSTKFPSITARAQYVSSKFRGIYSIFKKNVFWLYLF